VAVVDLAHAREQGFTSGVNNYCPQLIGCAQMGLNNEKVMDMGQPAVLATAGILNAVAVGATYTPLTSWALVTSSMARSSPRLGAGRSTSSSVARARIR
jgi:hypothetical protein